MTIKRQILLATVGLFVAAAAQAQVITQWNFNSTTPDSNPATGTLTPSTGAGTATNIGGTTTLFGAGSPSDPAPTADNSAWQTTTYPAATAASGTAGVQFNVSTAGFFDPIQLSLDLRQSGTAARNFQLLVSSDGVNFAAPSGGTASFGLAPSPNTSTSFTSTGLYTNDSGAGTQTFVQNIQYTFGAGSPYANDPNFAFRWVAVFNPANNTSYSPADSTNTYKTTGNVRFDMVTVSSVPEPSTVSLLAGAALLGAAQYLRRRRS